MPIAAAAALGIGGIVTSLTGAHQASNAAKDAAKLQVAASDKAQIYNDRAYADQQRAMNPYMQLGADAMARYQQRYGGGAPAPRPAPMGAPPMGAAPQGQPQGMSPFGGRPPMPPQAGAVPQAGPMVKLQAPTGEVQDVPQQVADQLIARGAVRVG